MKVLCPLCMHKSNLNNELSACEQCGCRFMSGVGILDFVRSTDSVEERNFYDRAYGAGDGIVSIKNDVSILSQEWLAPEAPENRVLH